MSAPDYERSSYGEDVWDDEPWGEDAQYCPSCDQPCDHLFCCDSCGEAMCGRCFGAPVDDLFRRMCAGCIADDTRTYEERRRSVRGRLEHAWWRLRWALRGRGDAKWRAPF